MYNYIYIYLNIIITFIILLFKYTIFIVYYTIIIIILLLIILIIRNYNKYETNLFFKKVILFADRLVGYSVE